MPETKTKYLVLVGINYPPDDTRANVGDVLTDLDEKLAQRLLNYGVIEKLDERGETPPKETTGTLTEQHGDPVLEAPADAPAEVKK